MSEQSDALTLLGIRDVLEVHQAGRVIGVQVPPEEMDRLLGLVEFLRIDAINAAIANGDEQQAQWLRMLTAADLPQPEA